MFYSESGFWNGERVEAFVTSVDAVRKVSGHICVDVSIRSTIYDVKVSVLLYLCGCIFFRGK